MSPSPLDYHHAVNCLGAALIVLSLLIPCFVKLAGRVALICAAVFLVGIFLANL